MLALDTIRLRLEQLGFSPPAIPREKKPDQVAFVDVNACVACGLCAPHCPANCIETLPDGTIPGRDPQPVQVRYTECVGCRLCVEVCSLLTPAAAIRSYDANLVEQVLGIEIGDQPQANDEPLEAWDEYWAEEGGFHHMGEGSQIADHLSEEERATLASGRREGSDLS